MNKLEGLRCLELMCKSLISVIELHRAGVESYDDVIVRANWLSHYIKTSLNGNYPNKEEEQ